MRRLCLCIALLALASCKNVPESVQQVQDFYAKVDSAQFDKAWDMLVDDEKVLLDKPAFVKLFTDSLRVPGFDTTDEWAVESSSGNETQVRAYRRAPSWDIIDGIKSHRTRRELLKGLAEGGNIPLHKDTTRLVTVVTTPQGPRFRVGLKAMIEFQKQREKVLQSLAQNVTVSLKHGVVENNFQAFFHVTGSVKNDGDVDLKPVVFQVFIHGKLSGTTTLKEVVSAKGSYSGEMTADYENGLTPQKFGTSWDRGAVVISGLSTKVVSAAPADRKELDRQVARSLGGKSPVWLF
jgi:hypothetical protein